MFRKSSIRKKNKFDYLIEITLTVLVLVAISYVIYKYFQTPKRLNNK